MTFHQWKVAADAACREMTGLHCDDFPDWNYYDAWEDGQCPRECALEMLEGNGYAV